MRTFTRRWFDSHRTNWWNTLSPLAVQPLTYLEIGIFEGYSGSWMLENVLTHPDSRYVGIDPWILLAKRYPDPGVIERRAHANLAPFEDKATIIKGQSQEVLQVGLFGPASIDIVYVDGDHSREGALADSQLVWPLVKGGGIIIWDDYRMRFSCGVQEAVDDFLRGVGGQYEMLFKGSQLAIRKHILASSPMCPAIV